LTLMRHRQKPLTALDEGCYIWSRTNFSSRRPA